MLNQDFPEIKPKVVLGVAAHPDDLDFGAAGTAAKYAQAGADVYYLILTDGGKGTEDRHLTPAELTKTRHHEQREAGKLSGLKDVFFLNYEDGALEVTQKLKQDIARYIRMLKPDVVITIDPSVLYSAEWGMINHPDHRAAGQATLDAVFPLARDHLAFPELLQEGLEPHKVATVLLINFSPDQGNFAVDITNTIEAKCAAIAAHASQFSDILAIQQLLRARAATAGQAAGIAAAETFVRIDIQ